MKPPSLGKLLDPTDAQTLLAQFSRLIDGSVTLAIFDRRSRLLASYPPGEGDPLAKAATAALLADQPLVNATYRAMPIVADAQPAGVLVGTPPSAPEPQAVLDGLLSVLTTLVGQAVERKALAQELLDRYREINLLYRVQETIGAYIDLKEVAVNALAESVRIVKADGGALFLCDEATGQLDLLTAEGDAPQMFHGQGIPQWVARQGRSAIVNDDPRHTVCGGLPDLETPALRAVENSGKGAGRPVPV